MVVLSQYITALFSYIMTGGPFLIRSHHIINASQQIVVPMRQ